ncbi:MAG TPA: serine/threonine-protein kinase, partial [Polyangiaceae bacterium]
MDVPITEIIAGKYRLLRKLGQGGMGSVWYAEHLTLHSPVAIKLIDPSIADNAEALGRFLREAQSAASLRSPHVVQILDHGVDNGVPYIAMELLEGESLADRLTRVGRLSPGETARVLQHVARAIGRAHEAGIVHRDLKPDNIYLVRNDDEEIAKVLDFGIAKSNAHGLGASAGGGTRTGAVLGTPYYMSPEQAEGAKTLDGRADIWAMGVIAFECLLGSRPFDEETLGSLLLAICARPIPIPSQRGPVPPGFDEWFARACARDVTERYAAARDAAADLRQVCDGKLSTSGNYGPPPNAPGALGSQTPAPHFGTANLAVAAANSGAVSGQSVPGFASTQIEQPAGVPTKSGGGLALVLAAVGILVVAGGVLAWRHLSGGPSAAASASASSAPTAPLVLSTPAPVEPSIAPAPAPVASVTAPIPEPA